MDWNELLYQTKELLSRTTGEPGHENVQGVLQPVFYVIQASNTRYPGKHRLLGGQFLTKENGFLRINGKFRQLLIAKINRAKRKWSKYKAQERESDGTPS